MIILDFGSGNSCLNQESIISDMIEQFIKVDSHKHEVVIKWQLFEKAGDNIPLRRDSFIYAYKLAEKYGYQTTASIFDMDSLNFLLKFDIPFVKIANNRKLDRLIGYIPRRISVFVSIDDCLEYRIPVGYTDYLCCISDYPASIKAYEQTFHPHQLKHSISDHTTDWKLYKKYQPELYEVHYCLEDSTGLDSGPFAKRPKQLREIL